MIRKYIFPFFLSIIVFSVMGFYPADCSTEGKSTSCLTGNPAQTDSCTWNGIELKGKVQLVESFPDFKVQVVDTFPDIKVQVVNAFPGMP